MNTAYVYIMAGPTRTIYVGVTSNLERRVWEHKTRFKEGFTKQYNVTRLVYIAKFANIDDAIAWEKAVKGKTRARKIALIEKQNPRWNDLAWNWYEEEPSLGEAPALPSHLRGRHIPSLFNRSPYYRSRAISMRASLRALVASGERALMRRWLGSSGLSTRWTWMPRADSSA